MKKQALMAMAGILMISPAVYGAETLLVSSKTTGPIVLDGIADKAWEGAKALTVTLDQLPYEPDNGYPGMKSTAVSLKSLYDDNTSTSSSATKTPPRPARPS